MLHWLHSCGQNLSVIGELILKTKMGETPGKMLRILELGWNDAGQLGDHDTNVSEIFRGMFSGIDYEYFHTGSCSNRLMA